MQTEILNKGSLAKCRTRIIITKSNNNDKKILSFVGQNAWLYEEGPFTWIQTDDNTMLKLIGPGLNRSHEYEFCD